MIIIYVVNTRTNQYACISRFSSAKHSNGRIKASVRQHIRSARRSKSSKAKQSCKDIAKTFDISLSSVYRYSR